MDSYLRNPPDAPLSSSVQRGQTKSRQRVRDLAEVYTHAREVAAMLDLVSCMVPSPHSPGNTDCTFLEPACGNGNFLVEILRRKLRYVTPDRFGTRELFEHRILRCVASIYGIDISLENVDEARLRMRLQIADHVVSHQVSDGMSEGLRGGVDAILQTNIIRADALADAAIIEMIEYKPAGMATFLREWSHPLDATPSQSSLFSEPMRRDEVPVHYTDLAHQTGPVLVDRARPRAA